MHLWDIEIARGRQALLRDEASRLRPRHVRRVAHRMTLRSTRAASRARLAVARAW